MQKTEKVIDKKEEISKIIDYIIRVHALAKLLDDPQVSGSIILRDKEPILPQAAIEEIVTKRGEKKEECATAKKLDQDQSDFVSAMTALAMLLLEKTSLNLYFPDLLATAIEKAAIDICETSIIDFYAIENIPERIDPICEKVRAVLIECFKNLKVCANNLFEVQFLLSILREDQIKNAWGKVDSLVAEKFIAASAKNTIDISNTETLVNELMISAPLVEQLLPSEEIKKSQFSLLEANKCVKCEKKELEKPIYGTNACGMHEITEANIREKIQAAKEIEIEEKKKTIRFIIRAHALAYLLDNQYSFGPRIFCSKKPILDNETLKGIFFIKENKGLSTAELLKKRPEDFRVILLTLTRFLLARTLIDSHFDTGLYAGIEKLYKNIDRFSMDSFFLCEDLYSRTQLICKMLKNFLVEHLENLKSVEKNSSSTLKFNLLTSILKGYPITGFWEGANVKIIKRFNENTVDVDNKLEVLVNELMQFLPAIGETAQEEIEFIHPKEDKKGEEPLISETAMPKDTKIFEKHRPFGEDKLLEEEIKASEKEKLIEEDKKQPVGEMEAVHSKEDVKSQSANFEPVLYETSKEELKEIEELTKAAYDLGFHEVENLEEQLRFKNILNLHKKYTAINCPISKGYNDYYYNQELIKTEEGTIKQGEFLFIYFLFESRIFFCLLSDPLNIKICKGLEPLYDLKEFAKILKDHFANKEELEKNTFKYLITKMTKRLRLLDVIETSWLDKRGFIGKAIEQIHKWSDEASIAIVLNPEQEVSEKDAIKIIERLCSFIKSKLIDILEDLFVDEKTKEGKGEHHKLCLHLLLMMLGERMVYRYKDLDIDRMIKTPNLEYRDENSIVLVLIGIIAAFNKACIEKTCKVI